MKRSVLQVLAGYDTAAEQLQRLHNERGFMRRVLLRRDGRTQLARLEAELRTHARASEKHLSVEALARLLRLRSG